MSAKKTTTKKSTPKPAKPAKATKAAPEKANGKVSQLDAAARVLGEAKAPLGCKEMVERMVAKGYWSSPGGLTPHATLYSAILREIGMKKSESRFKKAAPGKFALAAK